ncbi:MAG TPA: hypothetical protein VLS93_12865 [Anaeromyxobacteraceae bacterium]|nr:hypothetical protein [Anaeromyxobacteraceae bacterium]
MSTWALIVFVVVVAGATLWATAGGGAARRGRPRQPARRASLEVGPPIDTIRLQPGRRTPVPGEGNARRGLP